MSTFMAYNHNGTPLMKEVTSDEKQAIATVNEYANATGNWATYDYCPPECAEMYLDAVCDYLASQKRANPTTTRSAFWC